MASKSNKSKANRIKDIRAKFELTVEDELAARQGVGKAILKGIEQECAEYQEHEYNKALSAAKRRLKIKRATRDERLKDTNEERVLQRAMDEMYVEKPKGKGKGKKSKAKAAKSNGKGKSDLPSNVAAPN